jgi:hypothetical protein
MVIADMSKQKHYYHNPKTGFIASGKPEVDKILVKNSNITIGVINILGNWQLFGRQEPQSKFSWQGEMAKLYWGQETCERFLISRVLEKGSREIGKCDIMELAFRNRGMKEIDNIWLAWHEFETLEECYYLNIRRQYFAR